ncbi:hypothetical protein AB0I51_46055, partial [Streptomyces sp. NPDC050549]|uniref:hypothetical protein n=1 Tax=Streptomyces sp. NPDC050549 TaxID=3155406 RepID=UPI003430E72A
LLPCVGPHAITRSGTLFDRPSLVIDKRMTSKDHSGRDPRDETGPAWRRQHNSFHVLSPPAGADLSEDREP